MTTILFENTNAALDAAYMLRGEWDGFNGVIVQHLDLAALSFVANQVQSDYCKEGTVLNLPITIKNLNLHANGLKNFQEVDLRYADLNGAFLAEFNFKDANLRHANLRGANLKNANFQGADLFGASLELSDLTGANLHSVDLSLANIKGAKLTKANLTKVVLRKVIRDNSIFLLVKFLIQNIVYDLKDINSLVYQCGWFPISLLVISIIILTIYFPLFQIFLAIKEVVLFNGFALLAFTLLQFIIFTKNKFDTLSDTKIVVQFMLLVQPFLVVSQTADQFQMPISVVICIIAGVGTILSVWRFFRVNLGFSL